MDKGPFIRVSADGKRHVIYLLPDESASTPRFDAILQAVSPSGSYYLVAHNQSGSVAIRYKDDGSVLSEHTLQLPEKAYPQKFAVADSGVLYISGYIEGGPANKSKKSFAALLADDGRTIVDLSKGLEDVDLLSLSLLKKGAVTAGRDGLFYILQSQRIEVLDQSGQIEKELKFQSPGESWSAVRLDVSGGLAAVRFVAPDPEANGMVHVSSRRLLIDAQTGESRGWYVFSPRTPSSILCFSRQDGFSVYGVEKGQAVRRWYTLQ